MPVSDLADNYFSDNSITYSDVETNICFYVPIILFNNSRQVEYRQITIPDNTSDNFHMYQFDNNEHAQSYYNGVVGRLTEPETLTFEISTAYSTVDTFENDATDDLTLAVHGDGILFDTETAERDVILEIGYTNKARTNLIQEMRDAIKMCYYYLYIDDLDNFYLYMRRLEKIKSNTANENTKTKPGRKVIYSRLIPNSL